MGPKLWTRENPRLSHFRVGPSGPQEVRLDPDGGRGYRLEASSGGGVYKPEQGQSFYWSSSLVSGYPVSSTRLSPMYKGPRDSHSDGV